MLLEMVYFNTRDVAAIALCSALWGVLNSFFAPIFFQIFHLPFFCDMIGFISLILVVWWTRRFGAATSVGLIATAINFVLRPGAFHFLGFTAASVLFDVLVVLVGYKNAFEKKLIGIICLILASVLSAALAGLIIGSLFMPAPALAMWSGILGWSGLHGVGGVIGSVIGVTLTRALTARGILPP